MDDIKEALDRIQTSLNVLNGTVLEMRAYMRGWDIPEKEEPDAWLPFVEDDSDE